MKLLSFLSSREIGAVGNTGFNCTNERPRLDSLMLRLACKDNDVYTTVSEVPPFACRFRRDQSRELLAVADEEGYIQLIETDRQGFLGSFKAHDNAIFDICWLPDKHQLVTGSGDSSASLWDMNTLQRLGCFRKHTESVKCVDACPTDSNLFATGSRDGSICVWDTRVKCSGCGISRDRPSIYIPFAHNRICNKKKSKTIPVSNVSAVAFQNNQHLVSAGACDGVTKVWDLRKSYICKPNQTPIPRYQMKYTKNKSGHGCTSLVFDSTFRKLYGCSTANKIFLFDCHSFTDSVVSYEGFRCETYYIKIALSADDQYLVSGSSDGSAYVWQTNKPGLPIMKLPGHESEASAVACSSNDVPKIVTCGDDEKILVWKVYNQECPEYSKFSYALPSVFNNEKKCPDDSPDLHLTSDTESSNKRTPSVNNIIRKTSAVTSIKSYFHPVLPGSSTSSSHSLALEGNSDSHLQNTEKKSNFPEQNILSPSKNVNHETVSAEVLRLPKIVYEYLDKENVLGQSSKVSSNSFGTSQVKRKLVSNDSMSKLEKSQFIKKGKQNHHSSDKTKNERSSGSIMDYFNASLSSEE